jgi:hypothetical protein
MLKQVIAHLLQREPKVPTEYARMLRSEYRNVPFDYVEYHLQTYKRLPTPEELQNAI